MGLESFGVSEVPKGQLGRTEVLRESLVQNIDQDFGVSALQVDLQSALLGQHGCCRDLTVLWVGYVWAGTLARTM